MSGDSLLAQYCEKCVIKAVFFNNTEDQLVIAQNFFGNHQQYQGNIRVLKLYGLVKMANLSQICYTEVLAQISKNKKGKSAKQSKQAAGQQKIPSL